MLSDWGSDKRKIGKGYESHQNIELGSSLFSSPIESKSLQKISGRGYSFLSNSKISSLSSTISSIALKFYEEQNFTVFSELPLIANKDSFTISGQFPKFISESYHLFTLKELEEIKQSVRSFSEDIFNVTIISRNSTSNDELLNSFNREINSFLSNLFSNKKEKYLIPTAEVPLVSLLLESLKTLNENKIIFPKDIHNDHLHFTNNNLNLTYFLEKDSYEIKKFLENSPSYPFIRYLSQTPCFRVESHAMSGGKDSRGLIRRHQFTKTELVSMTHPDFSKLEHLHFLVFVEDFLKLLDLPFRKVLLSR